MSTVQYHTLTSLIGKNNHKAFKDAAIELGLLKPNYDPTEKWKTHVIRVTRNTPKGPVPAFKYTREFVNFVFKARPKLAEELFKVNDKAILGHQSLSQYIGSSGHAAFKSVLEKMGVLTTLGEPIMDGKFKGHIKKQGFYYTYSAQLIVKVCMDHPEVLSLYPTLREKINPLRKALGLEPMQLPQIDQLADSSELADLELQ